MDIMWNVSETLKTACGSLSIQITPNDQWKGVKLSGTKHRVLKGISTVDIIKDGKTYKNIPQHWYMIEN